MVACENQRVPTVETIDYLRVCALEQRTVRVILPSELVAKKGKSRSARARCRRAAERLTASVRDEFSSGHRRAYRGEVALHIGLGGVSPINGAEAMRTIKALVDSLQGPVVPDDRAVGLLDVAPIPGPRAAQITVCSIREYADAYDVLNGARDDLDDEDRDRLDPWAFDREMLDEELLDHVREALADTRESTYLSDETREQLTGFYARQVREYELRTLLLAPYSPSDRPGDPSLQGRLWNDAPHLGGPASVVISAPDGGGESWTAIAKRAFETNFSRWPFLGELLAGSPVALDIAVGANGADHFDVDNLARRVLSALSRVAPDLHPPAGIRVYRRTGDDHSVVVRFHDPGRADALRMLMSGSPLALIGLRPDANAITRRRRPDDERMFDEIRTMSESLGRKREGQL